MNPTQKKFLLALKIQATNLLNYQTDLESPISRGAFLTIIERSTREETKNFLSESFNLITYFDQENNPIAQKKIYPFSHTKQTEYFSLTKIF